MFLGQAGAHRFYLRRPTSGFILLVASVLSFGLIRAAWVMLEAFLIPGTIRKYNNELITMLT